jgi:cytochrome c
MKTSFGAALLCLMFLILPSAFAAQGTPAEAVAMTKRAVALIKASGNDKAFADIANATNTSFHDRDLYVFVYDTNGICVAHGTNPKMVGKNLRDMRDRDGKYIIRAFIETAASEAGSGWVEYQWPNPTTNTVEPKAGYVERAGNLIVGAGVYK